jgi:hypothetical protein
VVVTILCDRDGYEICFVEDEATPTYDVIDFAERASRGGDGAPLPRGPPTHGRGDADTLLHVEDEEAFDAVRVRGRYLCLCRGLGARGSS